MKKLYIASDHGGFTLKEHLLTCGKFNFTDLGCGSNLSVDYPDIADKMATAILTDPGSSGILICGTGIGISIRANRYQQIRAAVVHSEFTAEMSKAHNNANIICLGGRITAPEDAILFIEKWISTSFEGGRHQVRLTKLDTPI